MNQTEIDNAVQAIVDDLAITQVGTRVYPRRVRRVMKLRSGGKVYYPGTPEYHRAFSHIYLAQGTTLLYDEKPDIRTQSDEPDIIDTSVMLEEEVVHTGVQTLQDRPSAVTLESVIQERSGSIDEDLYPPMETSMLIQMKKQDRKAATGTGKGGKTAEEPTITEKNKEYLEGFISEVDTEENRNRTDDELMYMKSSDIVNRDGYYDFLVPDDQQEYERSRLGPKQIGAVAGLLAVAGVCVYYIVTTLSGFALI